MSLPVDTEGLIAHYRASETGVDPDHLAAAIPAAIDAIYTARDSDQTMHQAGAAAAVAALQAAVGLPGGFEWRVSFVMWPHERPEPQRHERVTNDEEGARDQLKGLREMLAPHELRPCGDHIWEPKLERRPIREGEWEAVEE